MSRLIGLHPVLDVIGIAIVFVVEIVLVLEVLAPAAAIRAAVLPEQVLPDVPAASGLLLGADKVASGKQAGGF